MAFAMRSCSTLTSAPVRGRAPVPFVASNGMAWRQRVVQVKAQEGAASGLATKMATAAAAALLAFSPLSANATESGIMPSRDRAEDTAARSFLDANEKKGPQVQSRSSDPNSGNVDTKAIAGVSQADEREPAGRIPKSGPQTTIPFGEQLSNLKSQPAKPDGSDSPAAKKALDKLDEGSALAEADKRGRGVAWSFGSPAPQVNVVFGFGETGTTTDQLKKEGQDLKEALSNPAQSASNAASFTEQQAERIISNPTGGPEQSKKAAQQLADANSQVPKALQKGAQEAKDAVTE